MAGRISLHEDLNRHQEVRPGSERGFGITFAVVFAIIGIFPALFGDGGVRWWALALAVAFLAVALIRPGILGPLNLAWFRFGMLLGRVVTPVVMGGLYFLTVTPVGLLMRLFGKKPLPLSFDPQAPTYWIPRDPPGPEPETMRKQF